MKFILKEFHKKMEERVMDYLCRRDIRKELYYFLSQFLPDFDFIMNCIKEIERDY